MDLERNQEPEWVLPLLGIGALSLGIFLLTGRKKPLNPVFTPISVTFTSEVVHDQSYTFDVEMGEWDDGQTEQMLLNQGIGSTRLFGNFVDVYIYLIDDDERRQVFRFRRFVNRRGPQSFTVPRGIAKRNYWNRAEAVTVHNGYSYMAFNSRVATG